MTGLLNTGVITDKSGRGFMSLGGTWIDAHEPGSRWVYEKNVLLNKRWPQYAILILDTYPKFKLIKPRERYRKMTIKIFRTVSVDPWI
jgi:hypothetical protein